MTIYFFCNEEHMGSRLESQSLRCYKKSKGLIFFFFFFALSLLQNLNRMLKQTSNFTTKFGIYGIVETFFHLENPHVLKTINEINEVSNNRKMELNLTHHDE